MKLVKGLSNECAAKIIVARELSPYDNLEELQLRARANAGAIQFFDKSRLPLKV